MLKSHAEEIIAALWGIVLLLLIQIDAHWIFISMATLKFVTDTWFAIRTAWQEAKLSRWRRNS